MELEEKKQNLFDFERKILVLEGEIGGLRESLRERESAVKELEEKLKSASSSSSSSSAFVISPFILSFPFSLSLFFLSPFSSNFFLK